MTFYSSRYVNNLPIRKIPGYIDDELVNINMFLQEHVEKPLNHRRPLEFIKDILSGLETFTERWHEWKQHYKSALSMIDKYEKNLNICLETIDQVVCMILRTAHFSDDLQKGQLLWNLCYYRGGDNLYQSAKLLIVLGADVNTLGRENSMSALHAAAVKSQGVQLTALLKSKGALVFPSLEKSKESEGWHVFQKADEILFATPILLVAGNKCMESPLYTLPTELILLIANKCFSLFSEQ